MFVGIDSNSGESDTYLDVYMEGTAAAWVTVGISETSDMVGTCVVLCASIYFHLSGCGLHVIQLWWSGK